MGRLAGHAAKSLQLTGCHHQVHHRGSEEGELFHGVAVTVQMRTALFPNDRARQRDTTPSPRKVFFLLAETFREHWALQRFRLPTLGECMAALPAGAPDAAAARAVSAGCSAAQLAAAASAPPSSTSGLPASALPGPSAAPSCFGDYREVQSHDLAAYRCRKRGPSESQDFRSYACHVQNCVLSQFCTQ